MEDNYDVVVVGGAFSGSATGLLLKRERPALRIAIIERSTEFDRKVGEATTEVSGCFLTKRLCLSSHLIHHHIVKNGLRFWFSKTPEDAFDKCTEIGAQYQSRMPAFQVDREVLDTTLLNMAAQEGIDVFRPAKVVAIELSETGKNRLAVEINGVPREFSARWLVDASGRASVLPRKLGLLKSLPEHPTNSIWARFRNVKDLDGHELRSRFPEYADACQASRQSATNHLTGYGWWCWIIPLKGGDYSAGLVYDSRLYTPPQGGSISERLRTHLMADPVGRELFADAVPVDGDAKAYSSLPYYTEKIAGPGWQVVGDAAGFMDPLYSQGLDYCSWTVSSAVSRILDEHEGTRVDIADLNRRFLRSYHGWFQALYKDKYYYIGDAELMTAAFLIDLGLFFFAPVRALKKCSRMGFARFPFDGPGDGAVGKLMAFCNHRLAVLGQARHAAGQYGMQNNGRRTLIKGFEPTFKVLTLVRQGVMIWLGAEIRNAFLSRKHESLDGISKQSAASVS